MSLSQRFLTFFFFLITSAIAGESGRKTFEEVKPFIALDRIIIQFNDAILESQMKEFFERNSSLEDFSKTIDVDIPGLFITDLNHPASNYNELKSILSDLQSTGELIFANPIFRSPDRQEVYVLNEIFVKVKDERGHELLQQLSKELRFSINSYRYSSTIFIVTAEKACLFNSLELSYLLAKNEEFLFSEPNILFNPVVTTNDPLYTRQWHLKNTGSALQGTGTPGADISIENAWTISKGDASIKVAVLDSGVDTTHVELTANLLPGFDATGFGKEGFPNKRFDEDGHGTACAGIIAAVTDNSFGVAGVAPNCRIIPVRLFYYVDTTISGVSLGVQPYSTVQWMADGINWAAQIAKADVMSNSWGVPDILFNLLGGPVSLVDDAINQAIEGGRDGKGTPMLFSTGNDNSNSLLWPSRLESTIAVTATSMCDERKSPASCDGEDWGGHYGIGLDVGAPGVKITTLDMWGNSGYSSGHYATSFNGTSAACPIAAGVVALILSVRPGLSAYGARDVLRLSADKVGGYDYSTPTWSGTWSQELGFGRVNAFAALQLAATYTSIAKVNSNEHFLKAFPNPSLRNMTVSFFLDEYSDVDLIMSDVSGKTVYERHGQFQGGEHQFQLESPASNGVCFLTIIVDGKAYHRKLIFLGD